MKKYVKMRIFLKIIMPTKKGNILEFNQYIKSEKSHILFVLIL